MLARTNLRYLMTQRTPIRSKDSTSRISQMNRATAANKAGGIEKWTYNGTTWTLAYTLKDSGTVASIPWSSRPARRLLESSRLYATLQDATTTKLQQVTDLGAGSSFTTLANMATSRGFVFRGVALSAVPEASSFLFGGLICGVVGLNYYSRRLRRKTEKQALSV